MRIFSLGVLWILLAGLLFAAPNTLKKIEIRNNELRLGFSSWFDSANVHQMVLDNPSRQVIDIKNARLDPAQNLHNLKAEGVRSFRAAQRNKDTVRIVIETDDTYRCKGYQPMATHTSYRIPLPKASSCRTEIKARKHTETVPRKAPVRQAKKAPPPAKKKHHVARKQKPVAAEREPEEKKSFFSSIFSSSFSSSGRSSRGGPKGKYTVVVDPGHGGHDSGAIGGGRYEKDLVLQIAIRTAKELKKKGFNVKMTRASNRFIKLRNRTHYANQKKADIFVSIHANAIAGKRRFGKVYGVETYFLQTTRSARSKRIAALENSVVLDKNDYLSNDVILQAVLSGPKIELSHKLAIDVQSRILQDLRRKYKGVKDGGVKPAPFWVLVGAQMPSILVEVGYITNPVERRRLFTPEYQKRIARGIAEGVSNYLRLREKEMY